MRRTRICSMVMMAALLMTALGCGKPDPLRTQFPEDYARSYEVRTSTEFDMTIPGIGGSLSNSNRSRGVVTVSVLESTPDGGGKVSVRMDELSVRERFRIMDESLELNSEDANDPFAKAMNALAGEEYRATVQADGNVRAVEGLDQLLDKMLSAVGVGILSRDEIRAYMSEQWSEEQERLQLQRSIFPHLPMKNVERGATWTVTHTSTHPLPMTIEDTYTVINVFDDRVTADVATVVTPHPTKSSADFVELTLRMSAEGLGEGFVDIDRATGWLNEATSTLRVRAEAEIDGLPIPLPGGMPKIPLTLRIEINSVAI